MGESLARALDDADRQHNLVHPELSVVLNAYRLGVSVSVHAAIGAEIIHQHPAANGAAIGDTGHRDFRRLAGALPGLHEGGVVINFGSAVVMPEVFLKALTIARYTAEDPANFTDKYAGTDMVLPADAPYADDKCEELTYRNYSLEALEGR